MHLSAQYPTIQHKHAAQAIVDFFSRLPESEAVLLVNSCARGKATPDSCLDVVVMALPEVLAVRRAELEATWEDLYKGEAIFRELESAGKFSEVHLDIVDGRYRSRERDWTSGPDSFELEVGNHLAYSVPLWERGDYYRQLKARWLPYYGEDLRNKRLAQARRFCFNNLDHIPLYVERGLYFQSFDRLYNAYREFLQALFISRRTYPIAYDKWIREQVEAILGLPQLYAQLPRLFEIRHFESREIAEKGEDLRRLFEEYVLA
jgi:predicted nucleotidyltransferase